MTTLKPGKSVLLIVLVALSVLPGFANSQPRSFLSRYLYDDFRRHPVAETYEGTPAPVDLGSDPLARQFRTRLKEGAKEGPNFAGLYTIIEWGCGTNCQQVAVVDARTGRVCAWLTTGLGSSYKLDSKLFIKNPDVAACSQLAWCKTEYYLFKAGKFILLK
jgi:hypothetical protein